MADIPVGTVTFLFTDIEGSSTLWEKNPGAMRYALERHHAILNQTIEGNGGFVFKIVGDGFHAAFNAATDGLKAALEIQRSLRDEAWGEIGALLVRIGLHTGLAEQNGGDYLSSHTLNRTARIMSAGHGGQILISLAVLELVREQLPEEVRLRDLGEFQLKGLRRVERIFQIVAPDLIQDFPVLNSQIAIQPVSASKDDGQNPYDLLNRIVRGELVGRENEFELAVKLWQQTQSGEGSVLLISGEPGIGKTRLVRELASYTERHGGLALIGECFAEGGAPFAPIAQMIYAIAERSRDLIETKLPPVALADLAKLAPGLLVKFPDILPNPALDSDAEKQRLFESVVSLWGQLSVESALLIVLDDVHWADHGTLQLLHHMAVRMRRLPVMILVTYREVELDEARPLYQVLLDLSRDRLATRLKLGRLTKEQTRKMLQLMFAEEITEEFLKGIYSETEGNPFFTEEVCKALVESGKLAFRDGRWHRPDMADIIIPQSVRLAIQMRVNKLSEIARDVLTQAAVLGREFSFAALTLACDLDEEDLISAVEDAERAQLVQEVVGAKELTFSFAHALIPATMQGNMGTLRRRTLHRRAAGAIEKLYPEDYDSLARHYLAAGVKIPAIRNFLLVANRAAAVFAFENASLYLNDALNLIDQSIPADIQVEVIETLGDIDQKIGLATKAIVNYQNALEILNSMPGGFANGEIRLHRKIIESETSIIQYSVRQRYQAVAYASWDIGIKLAASRPPDSEIIRLYVACSKNAWMAMQPPEWNKAEEFARTAVEMAEKSMAPGDLSKALGALANIQGARSQFRERVETALRRLELSQEAGFSDAFEKTVILEEAGEALVYVGEYEQALMYLHQAESLANQIQSIRLITAALRYQAQCYFYLDRWDDVLTTEERRNTIERQYADVIERTGAMCFHMAVSASVRALRGEEVQSKELKAQSLAAMETGDGPMEGWGRSNFY